MLIALEIEVDQHLTDRFGADSGGEGVLAIFVLRVEQLILGEELVLLERGEATSLRIRRDAATGASLRRKSR